MGRFTKTNQPILKDGTVDWENNQSMGGDGIDEHSGHRITDAIAGTAGTDYIIKQQIDDHIAEPDPHPPYAEIVDEPDPSEYAPDHSHDPPYEYAPDSHDHNSLAYNSEYGTWQIEDFIMKWGRSKACQLTNTVSNYNGAATGSAGGILSQIVYFHTPFPTKCLNVQLFIEGAGGTGNFSQIQVGLVNIDAGEDGFRFDARKVMGTTDGAANDFYIKYMAIGY